MPKGKLRPQTAAFMVNKGLRCWNFGQGIKKWKNSLAAANAERCAFTLSEHWEGPEYATAACAKKPMVPGEPRLSRCLRNNSPGPAEIRRNSGPQASWRGDFAPSAEHRFTCMKMAIQILNFQSGVSMIQIALDRSPSRQALRAGSAGSTTCISCRKRKQKTIERRRIWPC